MGRCRPRGVIGAGYEGREISSFVAELVDQGVTRVVDVRLTPISRKRGFGKTALRAALAEVGIAYEHRPELGNPKENRPGFAGSEQEVRAAKQVYARRLSTPEGRAAVEWLRACGLREHVVVLCFEADRHRCHRDVVLDAVGARPAPGGE